MRALEARARILVLEEPAANVFPYAFEWLAEKIGEAVKYAYVVLTTHNPLLVGELLDRIEKVKVYYVARGGENMETRLYECDLDRMYRDFVSVKDLLHIPQHYKEYCREPRLEGRT